MIKYSTLPDDPNYLSLDLNPDYLLNYFNWCVAHGIGYSWGAKAPTGTLSNFPPKYTLSDCSNFVRCLIAYLTSGNLLLPDGSWNQYNWFLTTGQDGIKFKESSYSNCGLNDNHIRICFLLEDECGDRHVWLVYQGKTIECHGSAGTKSRPWDVSILKDHCNHCFVIT